MNKTVPVLKGKIHIKCYIKVANKIQCIINTEEGGKGRAIPEREYLS